MSSGGDFCTIINLKKSAHFDHYILFSGLSGLSAAVVIFVVVERRV